MSLPVSIEEIAGARRQVILTGRALPHRGGPSFGGSTRHSKEEYAGSSVATIQIFGRSEMDAQWEGMWSDRYIAGTTKVSGFPDVTTADDLVRVFEALRDGGGELRVQWGGYVRRGIIASFEPTPLREVDVRWNIEWVWTSRDDIDTPARATLDTPPDTSRLRQLLNSVDDMLAFEPTDVVRNYDATVRSAMREVRDRATAVLAIARQGQASALSPITLSQSLETQARALGREVGDLVVELSESPFRDASVSDTVIARLGIAVWQSSMTRRLSGLRGQVIRQQRATAANTRPDAATIVQVREGQTLRDLARIYYGSADAWQRIAEVNNLATSTVPAGTYINVPPLSTPVDPGFMERC